MTVVHARGTQDDGTDTVRNVERLQFADQTIDVQPLLTNTPATGTVTLSTATPAEGRQLTATRAFDDADGVDAATVAYSWQTETAPRTWVAGNTGVTFTPGQSQVGSRLRVVATFHDGDGVPESITSAPTAPVTKAGGAPIGAPAAALSAAPLAPLPTGALAGTRGLATPVVTALRVPRSVSAATTSPIRVSAVVPAAAPVLRIRVFRLTGPRTGAAAGERSPRRTLIATVYRSTPKPKSYTFRLTERPLRHLPAGRYRVEVRIGKSRAALGDPRARTVTVTNADGRR
jgi:hypothetical protein